MSIEINATNFLANPNLKFYARFESGALTTDSSGEGHTLTAISDPADDASGAFGNAVALDGNDAYSAVDHANFKPTGNFTIGFWIKGTVGNDDYVIQSFSRNTNFAGFYVRYTSAGVLSFVSGKNTGTTVGTDYQIVAEEDSNTLDGAWHFVVGTWDEAKLHLYIDGSEIGTGTVWANAPAYAATNYVRIGCSNYAGTNERFLQGNSIDDVFLINGTALSADQIKAIYLGLNWTSLNGLGLASIKDINGLAKESIKSFNGI